MKDIVEKIQEYRGWSDRDMGRHLGIHFTTIWRWRTQGPAATAGAARYVIMHEWKKIERAMKAKENA